MPSVDEIRTLTIKALTDQGSFDQAAAAVNKVADAQANLAVVSDTTTKATQSVAKAYENAQRSLDVNYRSSQQFNKTQLDLTRAYNEGLVSLDRYNQLSALNTQRLGQMSNAQQAVGAVMQDLNGRVAAATGSLGTMGQVLTAFGPAGIAVAAVVGTIALALNGMADAAHALAQKAEELRRFSDITGLTTQQVQALRMEASKFGVSGDEATTAIERFTAGFNELRLGQGALLTQIRRVNPALADQMQATTNAGDALTLFGRVLAQTDDIFQRNALVKAATGKGGLVNAEFLTNLNVDRLTQSFTDASRGLDEGLIKKLPLVENQINKLKTSMGDAFTKQFALPLLETELSLLQTIKDISTALANIKLSDDFKAFIAVATLLPRLAISTAIDPAASFRTARVQGLADRNDPLRTTPFQAPLRTSGVADLNDPLRALPSQAKTPEAIAAGLKDTVSLLGSAATLTEQYNAKVAELNTTENRAKLTAEDHARALGALGLQDAIARTQGLMAALGASAPIELAVLARQQQIAAERLKGIAVSKAQEDAQLALTRANALGLTAMKAQSDASNVEVATLNMSIGAAAAYKLEQDRINEAKRNGQTLSAQELADLHAQAVATGAVVDANEKLKIATQISRDQKLALLSPDDVAIANQLKNIYPDVATALGSSEAAALRLSGAIREGHENALKFVDTLVTGLFDARAGTDSVSKGFEALSKSLASTAIKQLLSGDFEKAAVSAISATVSWIASLVTHTQDLKAALALIDKTSALQTRQIVATQDQSTLAGQLMAFDHQANIQRMMEARDGGAAMVELETTLAEERMKIITDFNTQATQAAQQAAAAQEAIMKAAQQRIQSAQDRLFNATNDPNTLEGQLAAFDRQSQADRLAEQQAGGQALLDLDAAQAAERFNIIKTYNDKITADAAATAKTVLDAQTKAAQQIVDYLNNLNVGPDSSLSSQDRLAAAQTTFNATSALAATGNVDAYARVTTDAENLRKAAQDFYASGAGFQAVLASIKTTLTNLPVVSGSTDPLVNAMLGVKTAVVATTTAVTTDTTATSVLLNQSIVKLNTTADQMTTSVDLLRQIGQQEANVATGWYSRMVDQLLAIATYTKSMADYFSQFSRPSTVAAAPHSDFSWWNPLTWFQGGGVVGAYAPGGIVGNGLFNIDSVRARYAGGGDIALAGGEGIINAQRTRQLGGAAAIAMLNHGMLPGGGFAANDNRDYSQHFARLGDLNARGFSAVVTALREEVGALREEVARGNAANRLANNLRQRPGAPQAQKSA